MGKVHGDGTTWREPRAGGRKVWVYQWWFHNEQIQRVIGTARPEHNRHSKDSLSEREAWRRREMCVESRTLSEVSAQCTRLRAHLRVRLRTRLCSASLARYGTSLRRGSSCSKTTRPGRPRSRATDGCSTDTWRRS